MKDILKATLARETSADISVVYVYANNWASKMDNY